jgi:hypothetical protein
MKLPRPSIKKMRSALAVALTLWCAGAGCMIVSYAHGTAMGAEPRISAEASSLGEVSGSMSSHSCCKAHHAAKHKAGSKSQLSKVESTANLEQVRLSETSVPSGANSCCPLTSGSFVSAARVSSDSNISVSTQVNTFSPQLGNAQGNLNDYPLRLLNQEQTYLRYCSFLI